MRVISGAARRGTASGQRAERRHWAGETPVTFLKLRLKAASERACVWTLGGLLDEDQFDRLLAISEAALRPFAEADGRVRFAMPALVLTARKAA